MTTIRIYYVHMYSEWLESHYSCVIVNPVKKYHCKIETPKKCSFHDQISKFSIMYDADRIEIVLRRSITRMMGFDRWYDHPFRCVAYKIKQVIVFSQGSHLVILRLVTFFTRTRARRNSHIDLWFWLHKIVSMQIWNRWTTFAFSKNFSWSFFH